MTMKRRREMAKKSLSADLPYRHHHTKRTHTLCLLNENENETEGKLAERECHECVFIPCMKKNNMVTVPLSTCSLPASLCMQKINK